MKKDIYLIHSIWFALLSQILLQVFLYLSQYQISIEAFIYLAFVGPAFFLLQKRLCSQSRRPLAAGMIVAGIYAVFLIPLGIYTFTTTDIEVFAYFAILSGVPIFLALFLPLEYLVIKPFCRKRQEKAALDDKWSLKVVTLSAAFGLLSVLVFSILIFAVIILWGITSAITPGNFLCCAVLPFCSAFSHRHTT